MDMFSQAAQLFAGSNAASHHVHLHMTDDVVAERLRQIEMLLSDLLRANYQLLEQGNKIMIDTSAALSGVTKLVGDNASLRGLLKTIHDELVAVSQALATANANNDPAAQAQVQNDLNTIAGLANTEDTAVQAAITANPDPNAPAPAPAAAPAPTAQAINTAQNPS